MRPQADQLPVAREAEHRFSENQRRPLDALNGREVIAPRPIALAAWHASVPQRDQSGSPTELRRAIGFWRGRR